MSTKVKLGDRIFFVDFENNKPVRIKERKLHAKGTIYECYYNAPYWNARHHSTGSKKTIVSQIIEMAQNA